VLNFQIFEKNPTSPNIRITIRSSALIVNKSANVISAQFIVRFQTFLSDFKMGVECGYYYILKGLKNINESQCPHSVRPNALHHQD
jgi:hypothetical protein